MNRKEGSDRVLTSFDAPNHKKLLKQLNSDDATRRQHAVETARQLGANDLTRLAKEATQLYRWSWRRFMFSIPQFWCVVLLPSAYLLIWLLAKVFPVDMQRIGWWILFGGGGLMTFLCFHYISTEPARLYDGLRRAVAEKPETTPLGLLLDLHRWETLPAMTAPKNMPEQLLLPAIEQKLKQMQQDDYLDLTLAQKQALLAFLRRPLEHTVLTFTLLNVLKKVGDLNAVSVVKKVIAFKHPSQVAEQIRQAAQECLDSIQAKHAGEQPSRVLLRAADKNELAPTKSLLRPATFVAVASTPDQLLWASDGQNVRFPSLGTERAVCGYNDIRGDVVSTFSSEAETPEASITHSAVEVQVVCDKGE